MFHLTPAELRILRPLSTPRKIQDFLETLKMNFCDAGDTCWSPRVVLRERRAHCVEGAMLAALALRLHGHPPLLLDLTSTRNDLDHVIAPFRENRRWGAISKTNHAVLRYRDPVYTSIRELVMSYFHEYTSDDGKKTLRSYGGPINLRQFDRNGWMTDTQDVWYIAEYLADIPHTSILRPNQIARLRRAEPIEQQVGRMLRDQPNLLPSSQ